MLCAKKKCTNVISDATSDDEFYRSYDKHKDWKVFLLRIVVVSATWPEIKSCCYNLDMRCCAVKISWHAWICCCLLDMICVSSSSGFSAPVPYFNNGYIGKISCWLMSSQLTDELSSHSRFFFLAHQPPSRGFGNWFGGHNWICRFRDGI